MQRSVADVLWDSARLMGVDPTGMPLDPKAFTFEKGREAQLFDGRLIYIYI